jgi:hypothetical protein
MIIVDHIKVRRIACARIISRCHPPVRTAGKCTQNATIHMTVFASLACVKCCSASHNSTAKTLRYIANLSLAGRMRWIKNLQAEVEC